MNPVSYGVGGWLGLLCAYLWARKYGRNFVETLPIAGMGAVFGSSMFYIAAELLVVVGHMVLFTINTMLRTDILVFVGIPVLSFELMLHFRDTALLAAMGIKSEEETVAEAIRADTAEAAAAETTPSQSDTESSNDSDSATDDSGVSNTDADHADGEESTESDTTTDLATAVIEDKEDTESDTAVDNKEVDTLEKDTTDTIPVSAWPVQ